jgi:hypothetical protein
VEGDETDILQNKAYQESKQYKTKEIKIQEKKQ